MKTWLLGIVLTALAGGLARQLAPQGREQAMVRLVSGLLLTLAILRPLAGLQGEKWPLEREGLSLQAREQAASYRKSRQDELSAIIAEKTQAYILDKATRLGLTCTVTVTTAAGESGLPLPDTATIRGPYSEVLAECMAEEVGIPAEKQIWLEDETWREKTESEN